MASQPESPVDSDDQFEPFSSRCPGCGEMVDNRNIDDVLEHHQHVLRPKEYPPPWFQQSVVSLRDHTGVLHSTTRHPTRIGPDQTYGIPTEMRGRRYGH